jgi:hypothetical protein
MSWNYRIVDWGNGSFDVREVYYDLSGTILHWSANPRELTGETPDDIMGDLKRMLSDAERLPTLDYRELPGVTATTGAAGDAHGHDA